MVAASQVLCVSDKSNKGQCEQPNKAQKEKEKSEGKEQAPAAATTEGEGKENAPAATTTEGEAPELPVAEEDLASRKAQLIARDLGVGIDENVEFEVTIKNTFIYLTDPTLKELVQENKKAQRKRSCPPSPMSRTGSEMALQDMEQRGTSGANSGGSGGALPQQAESPSTSVGSVETPAAAVATHEERPSGPRGSNSKPTRSTAYSSAARTDVRKVFVGGVPQDMSQNDLYNFFSEKAPIKKAWLQKYSEEAPTNAHRGFGFVIFYDESAVQQLVDQQFFQLPDGKRLEVKRAVSSNDMRAPQVGPPLQQRQRNNMRDQGSPQPGQLGMQSIPRSPISVGVPMAPVFTMVPVLTGFVWGT